MTFVFALIAQISLGIGLTEAGIDNTAALILSIVPTFLVAAIESIAKGTKS